MRERLKSRLVTLREEFAKGERVLGDLDAQAASVRETLVRVSGAIRVLEELLAETDGD